MSSRSPLLIPRRTGAPGPPTDAAAEHSSPELLRVTDRHLVLQAQAGDPQAYGHLVQRYQDKVFALVLAMVGNTEDALDLTQEVFIKGYARLANFRQDAVFYTWLYRIALNACIDFQRRRKRQASFCSLEDLQSSGTEFEPATARLAEDPHRVLVNRELAARLQQALKSLSPLLRGAFVLHDQEGLSQQEVAAVLGCPLGTAKSRIQRARAGIRECLRPFVEEP